MSPHHPHGVGRFRTVIQEIPKEDTGLKGKCFVHVDHLNGEIIGLRLSEKGKDGSTLDRVFHAIGDALTAIVRDVQK
jgi:hypothetical protein